MTSTTQQTSAEPELASVSDTIRNTQDDIELASNTNVQNAAKLDDPYPVTLETPFDPTNPKDWSRAKKWTVTDVLSATGFNRIMVSTIMAPAIITIAAELHMSSAESAMALDIYLLATAFGPLVIGPLSEVWGRKPILHASNIWFLIWNIVCGFAKTRGTLIAARFLAGFGASAIYALAGGVLGDVWKPEERGKSLSIYILIPLLGAAVGPIIGGFMAERTTWRWMFWSTSIFQAVMIVASFLAFHETYAPLILKRKAAKLRKETAERLQGDRPLHISRIVGRSLARPLRLLAFHPIIQYLAFLSAFYYGILYIVLSTFSDLWVKQYHERIDNSGLHYIALALGEILGSQVNGPSMDRTFKYLKNRANGEERPEWHVPMMLPGALLGLSGSCVVDLGGLLFAFGGQIAGMPIQAYIIDSYPEHASSATAASQFLRSLTAFAFPLFAPKMYEALGYGLGNTTIACIGLAIGVPAPLILWYYGRRLRASAYGRL